uniref:Uncharacterized protein n=1 Tax=Populus trichocarpa TaxID=3694 RepID=A0A2K2CCH6_POPTR
MTEPKEIEKLEKDKKESMNRRRKISILKTTNKGKKLQKTEKGLFVPYRVMDVGDPIQLTEQDSPTINKQKVIACWEKKMNVVFSISVDGKVISKQAEEKHEVIRFYKGLYSLEK